MTAACSFVYPATTRSRTNAHRAPASPRFPLSLLLLLLLFCPYLRRSRAYLRCPVRSLDSGSIRASRRLLSFPPLAATISVVPPYSRCSPLPLSLSLLAFSRSISVESDFVVRSTPSSTYFHFCRSTHTIRISLTLSLARFLASTLSVLVPRYFYLSFPTQKFAVSSSRPPSPTLSALSLRPRVARYLHLSQEYPPSPSHPTRVVLPRSLCLSSTGSLSLSFCRSVRCCSFLSLSLSLARRTFVSSASLLRILSFSHARHIRVVLTCRSFVLCRILLRSDSVSSSLFSLVSSPPCVYIDCFCLSRAIILLSDVSFLPPRTYRCLFSVALGALLSRRLSFLYRAPVLYLPAPSARDGF